MIQETQAPTKRRASDKDLADFAALLALNNAAMQNLQADVNELRNTLELDLLEMRELLKIWRDAQGTVRLLSTIGNALKWAAGVGAVIAAFWFSITHGGTGK